MSKFLINAASVGLLLLAGAAVPLAVAGVDSGTPDLSAQDAGPEPEWATAEDFLVEPIASGFELPTAVAVVPGPGSGPLAVRYFVTELRGAIKAVTNDGSVFRFGQLMTFQPDIEFPAFDGEGGVAGICLDQSTGNVFVTYAYRDADGIVRNGLSRFETEPGSFSTEATKQVDISGNLGEFRSGLSHQIGGCQVHNDALFVSVGDGWDVTASRDPDVLLGTVIRVDFSGRPAQGNPFEAHSENRRFVWAWGLRNPFGIEVVDGEVFVSQNGVNVDAFLRVERGIDHLWDGTDASVVMNADYVFNPAVSPVQIDYVGPDQPGLPGSWVGGFYIALAGNEGDGIVFLRYDMESNRVMSTPSWLLRHTGTGDQAVTGVAVDSEGLVFTAMLPGADGTTSLMRVRYDPGRRSSNDLELSSSDTPLERFGCLGCHQYEGEGGGIGPSLDEISLRSRLEAVLFTEEYERSLRELDQLDEPPFNEFREERAEVLDADGNDRLRLWVKNRIIEPRFDRIDSQMPTLGISPSDAEMLAEFLLGEPTPWWKSLAFQVFGERDNAVWFGMGAVGGVLAAGLALTVWRWRHRKVESASEGSSE